MWTVIGNFMLNHIVDIVSIVVIFSVAIFLYVKGYNKNILNRLVLQLVVEAEKYLGTGTGTYKFNEVMVKLYATLPFIVRVFISQKKLTQLINDNARDLQKFLDEGGNLSEYQPNLDALNNKEE